MTMNTDFTKLLNNCLNRIDGNDDENVNIKTVVNDSGVFTENVETYSSSNSNSPVRPAIKNIIDEKIKQKDEDPLASPEIEKVNTITNSTDALRSGENKKECLEKEPEARILFSLKDFFERSKEIENKEQSSEYERQNNRGEEDSSGLDSNDGKDSFQDGDSDIVSDEDGTDLKDIKSDESEQIVDNSKRKDSGDMKIDVKATKRDDPKQNSELESELNVLEQWKQKLYDDVNGTNMAENMDESKVDKVNIEDDIEVGEHKKCDGVESIDEIDKSKKDEESQAEKEKCNDSDSDPKNLKIEGNRIFKNISISIVGGNSTNINMETLLTKKAPSDAPTPNETPNIFQTGSSISIKRQSDLDIPQPNLVPMVTLAENCTIEDTSEDEEDHEPKKNLAEQYDNCTHGDLMDYMCVDCTYDRWRCEWDFVKTCRVKKTKKTDPDQVNSVKIINEVNWEEVFAGVGVEKEVEGLDSNQEDPSPRKKVEGDDSNAENPCPKKKAKVEDSNQEKTFSKKKVKAEDSNQEDPCPKSQFSLGRGIDKIVANSEYFKKFPKQIKKGSATDERFDKQDPTVPEGWKYREFGRTNGRVDKEYCSPDFMVFRSKKAMMEYMKFVGITP